MSENNVKEWTEGKVVVFTSWFTTGLGVPSIVLYIIILIVLIKYRKDNFDTGFFSLFVSTGIGDILQFLLRLLWSKLPRLSKSLSDFLMTTKWFSTVCLTASFAMYQVQVVGVVFIALNRFLTFLALFGNKKYWTKRMTAFAITVQWFWAALYVSPLFFHEKFEVDLHNNTTYFLHFSLSDQAGQFYWLTSFVLDIFINSPAIIILYSMATVVLWLKRKNNLSAAQRRELHVERRLAITGAAISALYIVMDVSAVVEAFGLSGGPMAWTLMYIALDLFTYINPWLLMLFCKEVKRHFFMFFGYDSANTVHSRK